jgi:DNA end-binding protein Ku
MVMRSGARWAPLAIAAKEERKAMARPIWKGFISFGLVSIPVGLHSALESREELSFHLLHRKDLSRVDYKRYCVKEDVEVPWKEIVKGYEYQKGRFVVVEDEDFEKARVPASHTFSVRAFVPATSVDDLYFDHPYYLAPDGKAGTKAYALIRDALADEGKLGIGTIVIRQREHLGALEPAGDALVLTTMRFAHEIRSPGALDLPKARHGWTDKEMKLAHQLIDTLSAEWNPHDYKDTYTDALRKVIERKIAGEEIEVPETKPKPVIDLMKALQASLKTGTARKDLARAHGRGRRKIHRAKPAA